MNQIMAEDMPCMRKNGNLTLLRMLAARLLPGNRAADPPECRADAHRHPVNLLEYCTLIYPPLKIARRGKKQERGLPPVSCLIFIRLLVCHGTWIAPYCFASGCPCDWQLLNPAHRHDFLPF